MFGDLDYHQPSLQQPYEHGTMQRNFNHVVLTSIHSLTCVLKCLGLLFMTVISYLPNGYLL